MTELLPCPLCSSPAEFRFDGDVYTEFEFRIECTNKDCRLTLPSDGSHNGAHWEPRDDGLQWNTRLLPAKPQLEPDPYEYRTTQGGRKCWDGDPDLSAEGWEEYQPWERFDFHEERYWRKKK